MELNLLRDVLDRTTDDLLNSSSSSSIMSSLFDEVQEQVFNILNKHTHQRFIKSRQYRDLLLSRLNGKKSGGERSKVS